MRPVNSNGRWDCIAAVSRDPASARWCRRRRRSARPRPPPSTTANRTRSRSSPSKNASPGCPFTSARIARSAPRSPVIASAGPSALTLRMARLSSPLSTRPGAPSPSSPRLARVRLFVSRKLMPRARRQQHPHPALVVEQLQRAADQRAVGAGADDEGGEEGEDQGADQAAQAAVRAFESGEASGDGVGRHRRTSGGAPRRGAASRAAAARQMTSRSLSAATCSHE